MTLQEERQKALEAQQHANEEKYIYDFFKSTPACSPCEANSNVLRYFLDGVEITPNALREAYDILVNQDPSPLALRTERTIEHQDLRERKRLVDAIMETWDADQAWIENEEERWWLKNPTTGEFVHTTDELRAALEERQLRQKFAKMSVQELREFVKPKQQPEFPPIHPKWTGPIIRASDPATIRRLLQVHGEKLVNERIQGIS